MSRVAIIFRESRQLSTLPDDWAPEPLGARQNVSELVDRMMQTVASESLALTVTIEAEEDSALPRTLAVSGVWGDKEIEVISALCLTLEARFYDAEMAEFVEL